MQLKNVTRSLIKELIIYNCKKTKHRKQKNEIARLILLAAIKLDTAIHNKILYFYEKTVLYILLYAAQNIPRTFKNDHDTTLHSLICFYLANLLNIEPQDTLQEGRKSTQVSH